MKNKFLYWLGYGYIWSWDQWSKGFFVDNIHKHPLVSKIMCKLGRHDYIYVESLKNGEIGVLECFYCMKRLHCLKLSTGKD